MRPLPPAAAFITLLLAIPVLPCGGSAAAARLEAGEPLTEAFAAALIEAELRDRGEGERFEVRIERPALPLVNRATRPAEATLVDVRREPRDGRLTASIAVRLESGESSTITLGGRARRLVAVAVPNRTIPQGEAVAADDLDTLWLPDAPAVGASIAREPAELAGREARRLLVAGRPVRTTDLVTARLVQRGEAVSVVYAAGGLEMTTLGEALDAGGEGAIVRVRNAESGLVRKAVVVDRKVVRVSGPKDQAP